MMDFHPKDLPISKTFDLKDEADIPDVVDEMVRIGFKAIDGGFKILMPKETKIAKRIGYAVTTGITHGLGRKNEARDIRYWTYHHDDDHYAIVMISNTVLEKLGM